MARRVRNIASGYKILVVDDQEETLGSVRHLLEREGHRVVTAQSGEQALRVFQEHEVHLLLVDYFMPRMTGEDLVREIRNFDSYVQIILQTGYSGEKPPRTMLAELDIQGYHNKAEGPDALLLWIAVALKAHECIARLRERERMQAELVANVSHEFRNPLAVVSGYCELLSGGSFGALPDSALLPVQAVEDAARALSDLVSDFLHYAKLEARVLNLNYQAVPVADVALEMESFAAHWLSGKPVTFRCECDTAITEIVTDPAKLHTILRNLVSNAVKFTNAGSIELRVVPHAAGVAFMVGDSGPGILPDHLETIFEPFRQLDGSMTRKHSGIGLGLPLARKLARLLGGSIEVQSKLGVGSTFTLLLPRSPAATHDLSCVALRAA